MSSATRELEARLTRVEQELERLKAVLRVSEKEPWYRQILGDFEGDKAFAEIVRLGREIRRGKRKE